MNHDRCPVQDPMLPCQHATDLALIKEQIRQVQEQLQDGKEAFAAIKAQLQSLIETKQQATGAFNTVRAVLATLVTVAGVFLGWLQFWKNH